MRFLKALALAVALTAPIESASAQLQVVDLIGGINPTLRNGNLNDLTGAMQLDGAITSPADTQGTPPDGTRASNSNGTAGSNVTIPFFTAVRTTNLVGGNSFFGFDDGTGTALGGGGTDRAFVYNNGEVAGAVDLVHDQFAVGVASDGPSRFELFYEFSIDDAAGASFTAPLLSVAGTLLTPALVSAVDESAGATATVSSTDVLLTGGDNAFAIVSATYFYTPDLLATDTIDFTLSQRLLTDADGVTRAAIDNIGLNVAVQPVSVPEPGTLSVLALGGLAAFVRRKRSA